MIWYYFLLFFTTLITAAFSWIPTVTTLPSIGGIDIDAYFVQGMGFFYSYIDAYWPLKDLWTAVLFFLGYLMFKNIVLRFFFGSRSPD